jgi:hypothetical protein
MLKDLEFKQAEQKALFNDGEDDDENDNDIDEDNDIDNDYNYDDIEIDSNVCVTQK